MKLSNVLLAMLVVAPLSAHAAISLTSTIDGKAFEIPAAHADTPAAKEFLNSGKNTYLGNADAIKAGKKVFQLYSCTACHGAKGEGAVGPNLIDDKWNYAKNADDKGMFETIAAGTPGTSGGTMFIWHNQLEGKTGDGLSTDQILKAIAYIRTQYKGDGEKAWLK